MLMIEKLKELIIEQTITLNGLPNDEGSTSQLTKLAFARGKLKGLNDSLDALVDFEIDRLWQEIELRVGNAISKARPTEKLTLEEWNKLTNELRLPYIQEVLRMVSSYDNGPPKEVGTKEDILCRGCGKSLAEIEVSGHGYHIGDLIPTTSEYVGKQVTYSVEHFDYVGRIDKVTQDNYGLIYHVKGDDGITTPFRGDQIKLVNQGTPLL